MILALLLAAAQPASPPAPMSAIDAERAFAADAHKIGQWTAFRKWSTPDALMFTPQPIKAHDFLKGRKNPPVPVYWWPGRSYVSCDGTVAVNTGPWVRGYGKSVGFFTTVWVRQRNGGWKWVYDAGSDLKFMRDEGGDIAPVIASCPTRALPAATQRPIPATIKSGAGSSADGTLSWGWTVEADGKRTFQALQWDGKQRQAVIIDEVAAPQ